MNIFLTAIGTDSGKSVVSAILTEALQADYWKPIQAGFPTDTETVHQLLPTKKEKLEEAYLLKYPMSPHASANKEGVYVDLETIKIPSHKNENMIIEGAGGIMVPLNNKDMVIDIAEKFKLPVILVSNIYLGNINHTLLSINELKRRGLKLAGIVFNGDRNIDTENVILEHAEAPCLFHLPQLDEVTPDSIKRVAEEVRPQLYQLLNIENYA
ncbi:dethiobiotin synthase [Flammeovirga sp. SubArs3]|uniref:dethiobiotin synthase n=1 Tax=Flammeovirga sp. SubArs3 TaxID=2995316 RepID=UPI00248BB563|nr:dethiobiotin synthase [Flammeovirga sp. SubArs3]